MGETQSNTDSGTAESGRKPTIRQYWLGVFRAHPSWLHERSNDRPLEQYLKDHPEVEVVPQSAKQGLSTVKSGLRKEHLARKRGRKSGEAETPASASVPATAPRGRGRQAALEYLEERIDEVLTLAKNTEGEDLTRVIQSLKSARNYVIVLLHPG